MKRIGYLDGVDPMILTRLAAEGIGTIPISNGWDDHGKYIAHLTEADGLNLILSPFHKVMAAPGDPVGPHDVLTPAIKAGIPIYLVAPADIHEKAANLIGREDVEIISPEDVLEKVSSILGLNFAINSE